MRTETILKIWLPYIRLVALHTISTMRHGRIELELTVDIAAHHHPTTAVYNSNVLCNNFSDTPVAHSSYFYLARSSGWHIMCWNRMELDMKFALKNFDSRVMLSLD